MTWEVGEENLYICYWIDSHFSESCDAIKLVFAIKCVNETFMFKLNNLSLSELYVCSVRVYWRS